jgi:hypothetical protein
MVWVDATPLAAPSGGDMAVSFGQPVNVLMYASFTPGVGWSPAAVLAGDYRIRHPRVRVVGPRTCIFWTRQGGPGCSAVSEWTVR